MIIIVCTSCSLAIRTHGDAAETLVGTRCDWYPNNYPCPSCSGNMTYCESIDPTAMAVLQLHDVTPEEAFAALMGLGLPEERDCGYSAVVTAFQSPVASVGVRQLPRTNRSVLEWIEFEGGARLYLASGAEGAIVYRISSPRQFTDEVLNEVGTGA